MLPRKIVATVCTQGLGMIFDFYQQRTKDDAPFVGGWASNFTYDFEIMGATCGLELDYIPGAPINYDLVFLSQVRPSFLIRCWTTSQVRPSFLTWFSLSRGAAS